MEKGEKCEYNKHQQCISWYCPSARETYLMQTCHNLLYMYATVGSTQHWSTNKVFTLHKILLHLPVSNKSISEYLWHGSFPWNTPVAQTKVKWSCRIPQICLDTCILPNWMLIRDCQDFCIDYLLYIYAKFLLLPDYIYKHRCLRVDLNKLTVLRCACNGCLHVNIHVERVGLSTQIHPDHVHGLSHTCQYQPVPTGPQPYPQHPAHTSPWDLLANWVGNQVHTSSLLQQCRKYPQLAGSLASQPASHLASQPALVSLLNPALGSHVREISITIQFGQTDLWECVIDWT